MADCFVCGGWVFIQTHCDIIEDFTLEFADELVKLSKQLDFVIFEDRKFADIGEDVFIFQLSSSLGYMEANT